MTAPPLAFLKPGPGRRSGYCTPTCPCTAPAGQKFTRAYQVVNLWTGGGVGGRGRGGGCEGEGGGSHEVWEVFTASLKFFGSAK